MIAMSESTVRVYPGFELGAECTIEDFVILGKPCVALPPDARGGIVAARVGCGADGWLFEAGREQLSRLKAGCRYHPKRLIRFQDGCRRHPTTPATVRQQLKREQEIVRSALSAGVKSHPQD